MKPSSGPSPILEVARLVAVGSGLAVGLWALWTSIGVPSLVHSPDLWFLVLLATTMCCVGGFLTTRFRTAAMWFGLSLVGYGLTLQFVDAGTAVLYQHLRPAVAQLGAEDWRIAGGLGACVVLVVLGFVGRFEGLRSWAREHLGGWRVAAVVVAWAAVSASPLRDLSGFALEIAIATILQLSWTGAVILAALSLPPLDSTGLVPAVRRVRDRLWSAGDLAVPSVMAAFVVVASGTLAYLVWERHPHLSDEISFLFQAKYFATGALTAPGVPVPELFAAYQIECSVDRCLSVLQPGWPAVLSLGVRAGAPWMVNPLLGGLNVLLVFLFVRELYGQRLAEGSAVLLAASPWYLFLAMSYMNHQAALTGGMLGVLGTTLALRRGRAQWATLGGVGAGLASLMRPMDGVIVAVIAGAPLLFRGRARFRMRAVALFAVGTAAIGSFNLAYNYAITGAPLEFPVTSYVNELWGEGTNNLGFGPDRGIYPMWAHMDAFPGHSPFQAVVNAALNVTALHVDLFGWATGSLVPLLLLLVWARFMRADWLMFGWIVVINLLYALYWFASGPDFAARYWFLAVVPLVVLTMRGLQELSRSVEASAGRQGRVAVLFGTGLVILQALLVFLPWRSTDKYYRYFNNGPLAREIVEDPSWPDGVYLIRGANQPDYAAAMIYGAPALADGDVIFAYDSLPESADLLRSAFPDRRIIEVEGPSLRDGGYVVTEVLGGPPVGDSIR